MKLNISDTENGKSYSVEIPKEKEGLLVGKKIGEKIDGSIVGAAGYEFELTGGSDNSGFPMRKDISGNRKLKALLSSPPGFNPKRKGERRKKMVRGNTYSSEIVQVNVKVVKKGAQPLEELFGKKEKEEKKG